MGKVVEGDHYHANIICKNGSVMVLQVNPQITSVSNFTPPEIKKWSQQIVSAKSLSGMFTIEFVVAKQSQETTAIRMVPILQPSILAYGSDKEMVDLEQLLRFALNDEEKSGNSMDYEPFRKPYWILSAL